MTELIWPSNRQDQGSKATSRDAMSGIFLVTASNWLEISNGKGM